MAERTPDGSQLPLEAYFDSDGEQPQHDAAMASSDVSDYLDTDGAGHPVQDNGEDDTSPIPGGGPLLEEENPAKVFKTIHRDVQAQKRLAKNRAERSKHWKMVRSGCQFSILEKSEDRSYYKQIFPPGTDDTAQPIPNKIDDLCRKIVSQMMVDQFLPNPKPDGDSDRNRGAADLAKKFLRANATPEQCNDAGTFRDVLNMTMTDGSGYVFSWVDPVGGGWRPKQVKAHPQATDPQHPLQGPKLGPDGQPIVIQTAEGPQPITETTSDPILRYVTEDEETGQAQFTKDAAAAAREWLPAMKRMLLSPAQIRMHPRTADAFRAEAITLLMWEPLAQAKRRFKVLASMEKDQLRDLVGWRPTDWKALVPEALRDKIGSDETGAGEITDETYLFWYHRFCRVGPDYVDGGEVAVNGAKAGFVLYRDTLREDVELDDGTKEPVMWPIPVSQYRGLTDGDRGDPNGEAPVAIFGGAIEIYAHLYVSILDAIDKGLHPLSFIPATSPVSREDMNRRDGRPIEILVPEDKPTWEQPPSVPAFTPQILERVDEGMNSLAGTNQTSNGLDSEYSKSGVAKQVSINQAKVSLAQQYQGFVAGACHTWLIEAKLGQARFTVPQLVRLSGEDAAFKQKHFVGADMVGVSQVALQPGTGTMMSAPEKANFLGTFQNYKWLEPELAGELARASMADDLGLPPNVHEERIAREMAEWIEGPPDGWEEDFHANEQMKQQVQQQARIAQQQGMQPPPPPPLKPLFTPFHQQPNDTDPGVARIRALKLNRMMDTIDYSKQTPAWRSLVDQEYTKSFHNGGGQTVDQQAQAQQAAQAAGAGAQQGAEQGPPQYQQFVQDIVKRVVSLTQTDIAKAVAALEGLHSDGKAEPAAPGVDPRLAAQLEGSLAHQARTHEQAHTSAEKARDRAHEATQAALDRQHDLHKGAQSDQMKLKHSLVQSVVKAGQQPPGAPQQIPPATPLPAAMPTGPMGLPS